MNAFEERARAEGSAGTRPTERRVGQHHGTKPLPFPPGRFFPRARVTGRGLQLGLMSRAMSVSDRDCCREALTGDGPTTGSGIGA